MRSRGRRAGPLAGACCGQPMVEGRAATQAARPAARARWKRGLPSPDARGDQGGTVACRGPTQRVLAGDVGDAGRRCGGDGGDGPEEHRRRTAHVSPLDPVRAAIAEIAEYVDRKRGWYSLRRLGGTIVLFGIRYRLRHRNLYD